MRGARWHCSAHQEDYCAKCRAAPADAASAGGAGDIIDSSWRSLPAEKQENDPLGDMLAAQERMLQDRRLELREADEARQTHRANAWESSHPTQSKPAAAETSSRSEDITESEQVLREMGLSRCLEKNSITSCELMDENAAIKPQQWNGGTLRTPTHSETRLERTCDLTLVLAGDFLDELARGYSQEWFQELVRACAAKCRANREEFVSKLHDVAFEVQRPILVNWGFEGNLQGVFDMTSIIREHTGGNGKEVPAWFQKKRDACLTLLYGAGATQ